MGGGTNKLLSQLSDGFVSHGVLVHILGLTNDQKDTKRHQGLVCEVMIPQKYYIV